MTETCPPPSCGLKFLLLVRMPDERKNEKRGLLLVTEWGRGLSENSIHIGQRLSTGRALVTWQRLETFLVVKSGAVGATGIQWGQARDAATACHAQDRSHNRERLAPDVNTAETKEPCSAAQTPVDDRPPSCGRPNPPCLLSPPPQQEVLVSTTTTYSNLSPRSGCLLLPAPVRGAF